MTAFVNGLTKVVVGNSAATTAQFIVPPIFQNVSNGSIQYALMDASGSIYSTGVGINYLVTPIDNGNRITSDFSINVPSDIPINEIGTNYQVRFVLSLPDENTEFTIYDTLLILPSTSTPLGAEDTVDIIGNNIPLRLVTEAATQSPPTADVYQNNERFMENLTASGPMLLSDGYEYTLFVPTINSTLFPSLVPYNIVWKYETVPEYFETESSNLFLITPSIMQAMKDVYLTINKSRAKFGFDSVFNEKEVMSYLRQGADYFNALYNPTIFNFTNATGPVRHYWLQCSIVVALRSQYLMEAESAFNFSGQAISLDIDRSQYYESLASTIESGLQDPIRQLKANLTKRGIIAGDGNVNPTALAINAIGTIGVSASQVSNMRNSAINAWMIGPRY